MTTLKDILDKKETIHRLVKIFGYEQPRIYCDLEDDGLQLVVNEAPSTDEQYDTALSASLIEKLGCQVTVLVSSHLKQLYKKAILDRSISIEDSTKLEAAYGKALQKIEFRAPDDDESKFNFSQGKFLADKILDEVDFTEEDQKKPDSTTRKRKSDTEISSNRDKLIRLLLDPNNKPLLENKLINLSPNVFNTLENIFIDLLKEAKHQPDLKKQF